MRGLPDDDHRGDPDEQPMTTTSRSNSHHQWTRERSPASATAGRLVTRIRTRYDWRHPADAALGLLLMEVGDFAMLRRMLLGIRSRAPAQRTRR